MMNTEKYCLTLEDFGYPRYSSIVRRYYGTMGDVENLMEGLRNDDWTRTRYWETLEAFDCYERDDEVTHTTAGTEARFLAPAVMLARQETVLESRSWTCAGYSGALYPMYAQKVYVNQILLRGEDDLIYRCVKADFESLRICTPGMGWYVPADGGNGFPGMVKREGNAHKMQMYVEEACYEIDDLMTALEDMQEVSKINLAEACRDILGQV